MSKHNLEFTTEQLKLIDEFIDASKDNYVLEIDDPASAHVSKACHDFILDLEQTINKLVNNNGLPTAST